MTDATPHSLLDQIKAGYAFDGPALDFGAAVTDGTAHPDVSIRPPLAVMNRHGLVAGATGTGKTKTLQLMAEQLSGQGVPVFLAISRATFPVWRPRVSPTRRSAHVPWT